MVWPGSERQLRRAAGDWARLDLGVADPFVKVARWRSAEGAPAPRAPFARSARRPTQAAQPEQYHQPSRELADSYSAVNRVPRCVSARRARPKAAASSTRWRGCRGAGSALGTQSGRRVPRPFVFRHSWEGPRDRPARRNAGQALKFAPPRKPCPTGASLSSPAPSPNSICDVVAGGVWVDRREGRSRRRLRGGGASVARSAPFFSSGVAVWEAARPRTHDGDESDSRGRGR